MVYRLVKTLRKTFHQLFENSGFLPLSMLPLCCLCGFKQEINLVNSFNNLDNTLLFLQDDSDANPMNLGPSEKTRYVQNFLFHVVSEL